jgi:hypothetical protein
MADWNILEKAREADVESCFCARHPHMIQRSAPGYRPVTMTAFGPGVGGSFGRSQSGHLVDSSRSTRWSAGMLSQGGTVDPQSPTSVEHPLSPTSPTSGRDTPASSREEADDEGDELGPAAALVARAPRRVDNTGRWSQGTLGQYVAGSGYLQLLSPLSLTDVFISNRRIRTPSQHASSSTSSSSSRRRRRMDFLARSDSNATSSNGSHGTGGGGVGQGGGAVSRANSRSTGSGVSRSGSGKSKSSSSGSGSRRGAAGSVRRQRRLDRDGQQQQSVWEEQQQHYPPYDRIDEEGEGVPLPMPPYPAG